MVRYIKITPFLYKKILNVHIIINTGKLIHFFRSKKHRYKNNIRPEANVICFANDVIRCNKLDGGETEKTLPHNVCNPGNICYFNIRSLRALPKTFNSNRNIV